MNESIKGLCPIHKTFHIWGGCEVYNAVKDMRFGDQDRFTDPKHPQYEIYKDRKEEKIHDESYNLAVDDFLTYLTGKKHINGEPI